MAKEVSKISIIILLVLVVLVALLGVWTVLEKQTTMEKPTKTRSSSAGEVRVVILPSSTVPEGAEGAQEQTINT